MTCHPVVLEDEDGAPYPDHVQEVVGALRSILRKLVNPTVTTVQFRLLPGPRGPLVVTYPLGHGDGTGTQSVYLTTEEINAYNDAMEET